MNSYSLSSDSPRWWWGSAFGGSLALASVAVLGVFVGTNAAAGQNHFRDDPQVHHINTVVPTAESPCFVRPLSWNVGLDGPVPLCAQPRDQLPSFGLNAGSAAPSETTPAHIRQIRWIEQRL